MDGPLARGPPGRSGAEAPLRSVRLARRGGAACTGRGAGGRVSDDTCAAGCAAAAAPEPRLLLQPRAGMAKAEGVFSAREQGLACAGRRLRVLAPLLYKVPGRRTSGLMAVQYEVREAEEAKIIIK